MQSSEKELDLLEIVDSVIAAIRGKLETESLKPTVGDLIKLLLLRQELAGDRKDTKITAGWVEAWDATPTDQ